MVWSIQLYDLVRIKRSELVNRFEIGAWPYYTKQVADERCVTLSINYIIRHLCIN